MDKVKNFSKEIFSPDLTRRKLRLTQEGLSVEFPRLHELLSEKMKGKLLAPITKDTGLSPHQLSVYLQGASNTAVPLKDLWELLKSLKIQDQVFLFSQYRVGFSHPLFKNRLRDLRQTEMWTQEQAAEKIGIPVGTYVQYETGRRTPPFPAVVKIARAFDVDVNFFTDCEFETEEDTPNIPPEESLFGSNQIGPSDDPIPF